MQQTLTCPSCGSPLASSQKFCGVCGLNLAGTTQQQINACPTCGSTLPPGQQFCAVCGTRIGGTKQRQQAASQQAVISAPAQAATISSQITPEPATTIPASSATEGETEARPHKHRILTVAGVIFQILGWIVLVFGILASIAMLVFAAIGGTFMPAISGLSTIGGMSAILMAIGGIIASLVYGFGLLAFAEICYTVRDIDERVTGSR